MITKTQDSLDFSMSMAYMFLATSLINMKFRITKLYCRKEIQIDIVWNTIFIM